MNLENSKNELNAGKKCRKEAGRLSLLDQNNLALFEAALLESITEVNKKLQEKANPNWKHPNKIHHYNTSLHNAAFKGNAEICRILVNHRANLEIENIYGNKPLMFAAYYGKVDCARMLISLRADVSAYSTRNGLTALHKACMQGHVGIVELLLHHGAFTYALDRIGRTPDQVIGVDGQRKVAIEERQQISSLLQSEGGKHIFSTLHSEHELAFTLVFEVDQICSSCQIEVGSGKPVYICEQCSFLLCQTCLQDAEAMSEPIHSVSLTNKQAQTGEQNTNPCWFDLCLCLEH